MTDFPVLGIPGWSGHRGMAVVGGSSSGGSGSGGGSSSGGGPRVVDSVVHSYLTAGRRSAPLLVFAQSAVQEQSAAALRNLLGRRGRPEHAGLLGPPDLEETAVTVTGVSRPAVRHHWADPRVALLVFDWERTHVSVASWDHPLDEALLAALGPLRPLP
ncbi:hypothetical protein [Kitasatospora phosalacinea]|uniref:Uncharacterized protein n=1 Tax=Kitasatospora phosalacinea TaxID=2065 RepID=A0A9W6USR7_9ACTN|nr:hypothetical protein [Kitasatospora phosalacinea]GLW58422.1 hypothetical protein Kpho01_64330 [Kitasatospora phosalacinea]